MDGHVLRDVAGVDWGMVDSVRGWGSPRGIKRGSSVHQEKTKA